MADRWRARAPMPMARSGIAATAMNGKVFVFGGESTTGTIDRTESYDPARNEWESWAPMPTARHGLGVAVRGKEIYAISGGP
ncbi:MAG: kelch repeat-containing protein, partial [Candidatus Binatia bacterium]